MIGGISDEKIGSCNPIAAWGGGTYHGRGQAGSGSMWLRMHGGRGKQGGYVISPRTSDSSGWGGVMMCTVTIFDERGIPVVVEVTREVLQVFADYEREMERQRKADSRHRDCRSWDTCLMFEVSTEPLEQTLERIFLIREIQKILKEFTPKQRRRFLLHFAYGYTYLEIAKMEGSNKSTVMRSAKMTLKKIQKKLAA